MIDHTIVKGQGYRHSMKGPAGDDGVDYTKSFPIGIHEDELWINIALSGEMWTRVGNRKACISYGILRLKIIDQAGNVVDEIIDRKGTYLYEGALTETFHLNASSFLPLKKGVYTFQVEAQCLTSITGRPCDIENIDFRYMAVGISPVNPVGFPA